jgi:hypothetical protein
VPTGAHPASPWRATFTPLASRQATTRSPPSSAAAGSADRSSPKTAWCQSGRRHDQRAPAKELPASSRSPLPTVSVSRVGPRGARRSRTVTARRSSPSRASTARGAASSSARTSNAAGTTDDAARGSLKLRVIGA